MAQLNAKQLEALRIIKENKNVFITGPAGTGKSFLVKKILEAHRNQEGIEICSSTGTSAVNLNCGARTFHSWAGLGPNSEEESLRLTLYKIKKSNKADQIRRTKLLIIDEISMINAKLLEIVDDICKEIRGVNLPFGGIQVISLGDFLQLKPVSGDFAFKSPRWHKIFPHTVELEQPMRQKNPEFYKVLMEIREGNLSKESELFLKSRIKARVKLPPTMIVSLNEDVDFINSYYLEKLVKKEKVKTYKAIVKGPAEKIIHKYVPPPQTLVLTTNSRVMLLRNLDVSLGLCNGASGKIIDFNERGEPVVKFYGVESPITIKPHVWEYKTTKVTTFKQIPLKLLYGTSIHKIQGQTLDSVKIKLDNTVFAHGQAYVALGRVKSPENLCLISFDPNVIKAHPEAIEFYKNLRKKNSG